MTKKAYHHGNLREAILTSARTLLDQSGVEALSLRKVAQRTEVSPTALYSHFSDKGELLATLATQGFDQLSSRMEKEASDGAPGKPDSRSRLSGLARGYVLFAIENKHLFQLMFGREAGDLLSHPKLAEAGTRAYRLMADSVAIAMDKNDTETATGAAAAWSMVHGLSMLMIDGRIVAKHYGADNNRELVDRACAMLSFNS